VATCGPELVRMEGGLWIKKPRSENKQSMAVRKDQQQRAKEGADTKPMDDKSARSARGANRQPPKQAGTTSARPSQADESSVPKTPPSEPTEVTQSKPPIPELVRADPSKAPPPSPPPRLCSPAQSSSQKPTTSTTKMASNVSQKPAGQKDSLSSQSQAGAERRKTRTQQAVSAEAAGADEAAVAKQLPLPRPALDRGTCVPALRRSQVGETKPLQAAQTSCEPRSSHRDRKPLAEPKESRSKRPKESLRTNQSNGATSSIATDSYQPSRQSVP
jgi:hypothetical protein